jgi:1-deoxy-D-xylulose-5-phosphate synthase
LKREESAHDCWEAGHSSTALSALAGFEIARRMTQSTAKNVAIIGDGSLNSGLSFEALNFLGHEPGIAPIIILNDNEMSISKNVGTLAKLLNSLRTSRTYRKATTSKLVPRFFHDLKVRVGNMLRGFAKNMTIFDEFGLRYFGPVDGHNFKTLIRYLEVVKHLNRPCVLHVITKKGKGYLPAENDAYGLWHGVEPFDIASGMPLIKKTENIVSWSNIISDYLYEHAGSDDRFRVIIPAMINGSGLRRFQQDYPEKIIDVGICESFAVCMAAALSLESILVFVPIYSSFLQRAYDQVLHDVARQDQHVIFGIDRAGLVGGDGETHQGLYDISYLRHIPNMEIVQPKDAMEAWQLMDYAFHVTTHPIAIRYSRNKIEKSILPLKTTDQIVRPSWTIIREGTAAIVIAYGDNINRLDTLLAQSPHAVRLINARFIKPLDGAMLDSLLAEGLPIMVVEDVVAISGLGSAILEYCASHLNRILPISIQGLPDQFIEQGDNADIYQKYHLDDKSLMETLAELIENHH